MLRKFYLLLDICLLASLIAPVAGWLVPQPKANVWAALARAMGQDHICLSATSADNLLMTCLVEILFGPKELQAKLLEITKQNILHEDAYNVLKIGQQRLVTLFVIHCLESSEAKASSYKLA
ncbi:hypothetical protein DUI87_03814 [Hirundo rustica rustica]|uniref:Uncharacterized protein n=1 Tax=Hirundo rustica rustica TaxID=333673 RepID=A0A3M0L130_HIRRU|nr:hypothetical protein DUI87_03814 [Hirundo rustica rustica]